MEGSYYAKIKSWFIHFNGILYGFLVHFTYIYRNLDIDEQSQPSDVFVVLEGGADDRARRAVELLKKGYSRWDQIIVSPRNVTASWDNADWYFDAGASENQLILEYDVMNTWTNALNSLVVMDE